MCNCPFIELNLEDQSTPYDSKKNCWIPDPEEGYIAGEIVKTEKDKVTVKVAGGTEKTVKQEEIQEMNPPKFEKTVDLIKAVWGRSTSSQEDMSNLTFLNDASVLHNLRARYGCMLIYVHAQPILHLQTHSFADIFRTFLCGHQPL